jgi:transposase-like protein
MTSRLPPEIREQVLTLWLKAYSRDDIAKIMGIGSGTVSEIIKDYNRRNPGFDLLREFVVAIRKEGTVSGTMRLRCDFNGYLKVTA